MKDLIQQCKEELKRTRIMKETAPDYEQKVYASMLTDLEIAIVWMETGRPPGSVKGIYGSSPSTAICLEPDKFEYINQKLGFPIPLNPFEEVENRIDKERKASPHAKCV